MREGYRFACPIRVRYSEIDEQGIVYNSRYLEYIDVALTEYLRALGLQYHEMIEKQGFDPSLVKATLEFTRPARLDEELLIHARVSGIGRTSFTVDFEIVRQSGGELLTSARVVYVNFDKATQSSRPVPGEIRRRIEAFEGRSLTAPQ